MINLRAQVEKDLRHTLEGEFALPVELVAPDGEVYTQTADGRPLTGQVLYNTVRNDIDTANRVVTDTSVVTLRRSSLTRIPLAGEKWLVRIPESPVPGAAMVPRTLGQPPEGGAAIGFIRLYLHAVEQSGDDPVGADVTAALEAAQAPV